MHTHRNLKINRTPQRILRASIVNDHNASISTNNQRVYRLQSTLRTKNCGRNVVRPWTEEDGVEINDTTQDNEKENHVLSDM
ncbi:hypothetical protein ACS0TY_004542 [Phlomoides rotata]